ncbi:IclR family transcriptional regulator [Shinella sp. S4-D37]|uniref:IclR family transcriptional regulator n=1 Tax=Shinella sp. S4-D37 TaxID=3161999 RepID=UPI0034674140
MNSEIKAPSEIKSTKAEGGVQSLHRAMSILQTVARVGHGIGLGDLAKEVDLHTSTTFHLAKTLTVLGLLRQEPETKRYRVGPQLFSLATGALDEIELLSIAQPYIARLAEQTGESSHLAVRMGFEVVIINKIDGAASIRMTERVGTPRPPHATAIGKVILGGLSATSLREFMATAPFSAVTSKTITDADALAREIEAVRNNGIAFDDGEYDIDARCLAAPVYDFRNRLVAAIGVTSPVWRMGLQRVSETSEIVKTLAAELSEQLGYQNGKTASGID